MNRSEKKMLALLFIFLSIGTAFSQSLPPNFKTQLFNTFTKQILKAPQEKLYLQTDKPYYNAGESIWFKGYLVNAINHKPNAISRYIYVELIDKADTVVQRVKIRKDSLGFAGHLKLSPQLTAGYYTLRSYSYWMCNAGENFFFKKNIYIGNSIDERIKTSITYSKPANSKVVTIIKFRDGANNPLAKKIVFITINWTGKPEKTFSVITNENGQATFAVPMIGSGIKNKYILAEIRDQYLKFNQKFFIPPVTDDFDIQFFPEGGTLVANCMQAIAFKAIDSNGFGIKVTGKIVNSAGDELFDFQSTHRGMGKIIIQADSTQRYYAIVKAENGLEKKVEIKSAQPKGVTIQLKYHKGKIVYEIINNSDINSDSLVLMAHSRGKVLAIKELDSLSLDGQIVESDLPAGIVTFSVVEKATKKVYAERLYFVPLYDQTSVTMTPDKVWYGKRAPVNLQFAVTAKDSLPVNGDFSISVTDSKTVVHDTLADNIISNMLLVSDLKGYIEAPAEYLQAPTIAVREKQDLLMLTQGWRRFNMEDILKTKPLKLDYYLEAGQAISGKAVNLLNKPSRNAEIILISPTNFLFKTTTTDSLGCFVIDGISFADSSGFIIKAKKKRNIGDVEVILDQDVFPRSTAYIPYLKVGANPVPSDYFVQSKEKYYYDGGMRAVNLDEVTITARKKEIKSEEQYFYSGMEDNSISSEKLNGMVGMSIFDILSTVPGVNVSGEDISIRGSKGQPLFLIDGVEVQDKEEITYLNTDDLNGISVFKGANTAIFGSRGGNGVIAITLKKWADRKVVTAPSLASITPLGYQKPDQFYVPKYEVDSIRQNPKPDLRTTIYWNPSIKPNKNGTISVKFPTADNANDYTVTLEGLSDKGELYRYQSIIKRKND